MGPDGVLNRPDFDSLKQYLSDLGGDYVLTYDELNDRSLKDRVRGWTGGKVDTNPFLISIIPDRFA